ncbi:MAG TPA: flagellar biosynthesis regulator FlaF [Azospirillaceae bacterium]|nr:flagellar biosynthesis regulator FlaF [Azospirillaceae bacterium]
MKPAAGYTNRPTSENPRDVEAWGLTEAARRLIHAAQNPEDPDMLRQALSLNQRLWTIFQTAMVDPECQLPADIRDSILALSILVDKQTFDRLIDLDVTKLDRLIEINRNVAAGLSQRPAGGAQPTAQPIPQPVAAAPAAPVQPAAPQPAAPRPDLTKISLSI